MTNDLHVYVTHSDLDRRLDKLADGVEKRVGAVEHNLRGEISALEQRRPAREITRVIEHDDEGRIKAFERVTVQEPAVDVQDTGVDAHAIPKALNEISSLSSALASASTVVRDAARDRPGDARTWISNERFRAIMESASDAERTGLRSFHDMVSDIERHCRDLGLDAPPNVSDDPELNCLAATLFGSFRAAVHIISTQEIRIMRLERALLELEADRDA